MDVGSNKGKKENVIWMNLNIHIILSHAECGARIKKCSHKKLSLETSRHSHSCYFYGISAKTDIDSFYLSTVTLLEMNIW